VGARSKLTCSHSQIRWTAIAMTPWAWVIGILFLTQFHCFPHPVIRPVQGGDRVEDLSSPSRLMKHCSTVSAERVLSGIDSLIR
jgi:hypothetical protein